MLPNMYWTLIHENTDGAGENMSLLRTQACDSGCGETITNDGILTQYQTMSSGIPQCREEQEGWKWMCWGPFHELFFHCNSNSMRISFCSHPSGSEMIARKICTWHDSYMYVCKRYKPLRCAYDELFMAPIYGTRVFHERNPTRNSKVSV